MGSYEREAYLMWLVGKNLSAFHEDEEELEWVSFEPRDEPGIVTGDLCAFLGARGVLDVQLYVISAPITRTPTLPPGVLTGATSRP